MSLKTEIHLSKGGIKLDSFNRESTSLKQFDFVILSLGRAVYYKIFKKKTGDLFCQTHLC